MVEKWGGRSLEPYVLPCLARLFGYCQGQGPARLFGGLRWGWDTAPDQASFHQPGGGGFAPWGACKWKAHPGGVESHLPLPANSTHPEGGGDFPFLNNNNNNKQPDPDTGAHLGRFGTLADPLSPILRVQVRKFRPCQRGGHRYVSADLSKSCQGGMTSFPVWRQAKMEWCHRILLEPLETAPPLCQKKRPQSVQRRWGREQEPAPFATGNLFWKDQIVRNGPSVDRSTTLCDCGLGSSTSPGWRGVLLPRQPFQPKNSPAPSVAFFFCDGQEQGGISYFVSNPPPNNVPLGNITLSAEVNPKGGILVCGTIDWGGGGLFCGSW